MARTAELNLETAFVLNVTNVYEGSYFKIEFERFALDEVTSAETSEDWEDKPYTFVISATDGGAPLITLDAGEITIAGNKLTVECTDDKNIMQAVSTKKYFYNLWKEVETNKTQLEGKGSISVNPAIK